MLTKANEGLGMGHNKYIYNLGNGVSLFKALIDNVVMIIAEEGYKEEYYKSLSQPVYYLLSRVEEGFLDGDEENIF